MNADPINEFVENHKPEEIVSWMSGIVDKTLARTDRMLEDMEDSYILGCVVSDQRTLQAVLHALNEKLNRNNTGSVNIPVV